MKFFRQNNYTEKAKILYFLNLVYFLSMTKSCDLFTTDRPYVTLYDAIYKKGSKQIWSVYHWYQSFFYGTLHMWARVDEEHNYKEKNVYFSNMKKIIKHYPMTGRLIVIRGYLSGHCPVSVKGHSFFLFFTVVDMFSRFLFRTPWKTRMQ